MGASRVVRAALLACTTGLVVLALGATFGRCAVLPVPAAGDGTAVAPGSVVLAVPVAAPLLHAGDEVFLPGDGGQRASVRRVVAVRDSWQRHYEIDGIDGSRPAVVRMPPTAWKVVGSVPLVGRAFALLAGRVQGIALVGAGLVLLLSARRGRPLLRRRAGVASVGSIRWHPKTLSSPS